MHMADALVSPAVGGAMWAASAGLIGYCSKKVKTDVDERKIPLMGVLGAFIFAAQMINFAIPGTGASGHIGGGMILAILLGPYAAFLTMASILIIQALFFADGGLLSLGCNIFNLGFFPCFIAYPLCFRKIVGDEPSKSLFLFAVTLATVIGLQLGSLGVVLQTVLSGIAELPFKTFILLMQPIHLAIGLVEGLVAVGVVLFIWKARPEIIATAKTGSSEAGYSGKGLIGGFVAATLIVGGGLSWFASTHPDGLEWAMFRTAGSEEIAVPDSGIHTSLGGIQENVAVLPDYDFKSSESDAQAETSPVDAGTSVSGIVGSMLTLMMVLLLGLFLRKRGKITDSS